MYLFLNADATLTTSVISHQITISEYLMLYLLRKYNESCVTLILSH